MSDRFLSDIELPDVPENIVMPFPDPGFVQVFGRNGALVWQNSEGKELVAVTTKSLDRLNNSLPSVFVTNTDSDQYQKVVSLTIPANYMKSIFTIDFDMWAAVTQTNRSNSIHCALYVDDYQLVSCIIGAGSVALNELTYKAKGEMVWDGTKFCGNLSTNLSDVNVGASNINGVLATDAVDHVVDIRIQTSTADVGNFIKVVTATIRER